MPSLRDSARVFWGPMGAPSPVWGPLRGTETKRVGAHAAVVSMVVTPTIPSALVQHLHDEVLLKVRPHPDDTVRTLQERIARKSFFDDFRVLHVKGGSKYVHLNRTGMSQTRRVTFSEPLSAPYRDDDGDLVQDLLMYPHFYRHPDDNMCRPMTGAVKQLRDVLFAQAEPFLTQRCRQAGEPNSAEVMGYYGLFNSATGAPCKFPHECESCPLLLFALLRPALKLCAPHGRREVSFRRCLGPLCRRRRRRRHCC